MNKEQEVIELLEKIENSRTVTGPTDERLGIILELKKVARQAIAILKQLPAQTVSEFTKECRAHCEVYLRGGWTTQKQIKTIIKNVGLLGIEVRLSEARLAVKTSLEACDRLDKVAAVMRRCYESMKGSNCDEEQWLKDVLGESKDA